MTTTGEIGTYVPSMRYMPTKKIAPSNFKLSKDQEMEIKECFDFFDEHHKGNSVSSETWVATIC